MATTPTQLPVPSEKPQDLKFNAGKIDEFATSMGWTYYDRFGVRHYTIEGLKHIAEQAISAFGYITIDSFQAGAQLPNNQLTLPNQVLRDTSNGEYYRWDGVFPKTVTIASTPITTGGIGIGAWLSVGDATLRSNLNSNEVGKGASLVGTVSGYTVQEALDGMDERYEALIAPGSSSTINTVNGKLGDHSLGFDDNAALYTKGNQSPSSFRLDGFSLRGGVFEGIRVITVGDGGDFTSLNSAIEFASLFRPKYVNSPGYIHYRIEIEIQSGYIVTEQVVARQIDLSHITLTSVDAVVKVNVPTDLWWMYGEFAAHLPIIGTIFDLQHIGYDGLSLKMGSQAIVEYGHSRNGKPATKYAGIINAARHNVFINTECRFVGREGVFTGATEAGVHFEKHCTGCVRDADISGCTLFGIRLINGSTIDCYGVNVSNTSSGPGIQAEVGSSASGFGIIASNSKQGLRASFGSKIVATGSTFNSMAVSDAWAYASDGSDIVMTTATGTGGACACLAANGSRIDIQGVDASLSGSGSGNMRCLSGSTLAATGTTGTFNKAINVVDGNGIIFK